jgi:hypothetical protein
VSNVTPYNVALSQAAYSTARGFDGDYDEESFAFGYMHGIHHLLLMVSRDEVLVKWMASQDSFLPDERMISVSDFDQFKEFAADFYLSFFRQAREQTDFLNLGDNSE